MDKLSKLPKKALNITLFTIFLYLCQGSVPQEAFANSSNSQSNQKAGIPNKRGNGGTRLISDFPELTISEESMGNFFDLH